jgi:uncharacterized protein
MYHVKIAIVSKKKNLSQILIYLRDKFTNMLVRVVVQNLFSFDTTTEFNLLAGRSNRLKHHEINKGPVTLLKLSAIYGPNGAGKSNLIKAVESLKDFVISGQLPIAFISQSFKFNSEGRKNDVYVGLEFFVNDSPYYYGLTVNQGIIIDEELSISGLGKKNDHLLFKRTDEVTSKKLSVVFSDTILKDEESKLFPGFLQNEILERNVPVLFHMRNRTNSSFFLYKQVFEWFEKDLIIIRPDYKTNGLAFRIEKDDKFRAFANEMMQSFQTGVKSLEIETVPLEKYFGEDNKDDNDRVSAELLGKPGSFKVFHLERGEIVALVEQGRPVMKRIHFLHQEDNGERHFEADDESDGTLRLLDYLPAIYFAIIMPKTYLIDEIERSIHPGLIKALVKKMSDDTTMKGQLIFTTHESNLLDQEIFRQDEIWFAEKNKRGATELYTLSDFKEHHTIDIRKGYLNGRYGAIPFLSNLQDLKWEKYAET